jgi:hypothetical protein
VVEVVGGEVSTASSSPPTPPKKKKNRWRHRTTGDSNLGSNAATVTIYLIVLFFKFLSPLLISTMTLTFFGLNYTSGSEVGIYLFNFVSAEY